MGTIDCVSVRWGSPQNKIVWHSPPESLPLDRLLPIFLSGLVETQVCSRPPWRHWHTDSKHVFSSARFSTSATSLQT